MAIGNSLSPLVEQAKVHPCDIEGMYYFHGSCVKFTLSVTGNTTVELGKFGAYKGIKITTTFSAMENPPKGVKSVAAIMGDATGTGGDITGTVKGKAFPLYGQGEDCVSSQNKKEFCPGKPFVYAELINQSKYTLKPKDTPKFYIVDTNKFPGTRLCFPANFHDARTEDPGWLGSQHDARRTAARDDADDPGAAESGTAHLSARAVYRSGGMRVGPVPSTAALRASAQDDIRRTPP